MVRRKKFIIILIGKHLPQISWRQVIAGISFTLNATRTTTTTTTTDYASFEIIYGRKSVLPEDLLLETVPDDASQEGFPANYMHDLKHGMQLIN